MTNLSSIIETIFAFSVGLTALRIYLQVNKVWKRKHEKTVAESLSIMGALISVWFYLAFLAKATLIDRNYSTIVNSLINLLYYTIVFFISTGFWVQENQPNKNFFRLILKALNLERREAGDLIKALIHPEGAEHILIILEKLAAVDQEIAEEEIKFINEFAHQWHLKPPQLKVGSIEGTSLREVRQATLDYLKINPPVEQAAQLVDLITLFIKADQKVTEEEKLLLGELSGLLQHYEQQNNQSVKVYEVLIVPQANKYKMMLTIKDVLPDTQIVKRRGGEVILIDRFFSEEYAEKISHKYIDLGLFSLVNVNLLGQNNN
jgi:uncharacterized protein with PQ loop repeat